MQMFVRIVLFIGLGWSLSNCQTNAKPSEQFSYQVRVRDTDSGATLTNAIVTIEIQASNLIPLVERTDSLGLARIPILNGYVNQPGRLIVELTGYETYTRFLDLTAGQLPENVFLRPMTTATVVPTAVVTLELMAPTATAQPSLPPPPSPTAEATAPPLPTETPTPTATATNTPTATPTATPIPDSLFTVETTAYIKVYASAEAVDAQAVGALAPGMQLDIIRTQPGFGRAEWYAFRLSPGLIAWVDACFTEPVRFDPGYVPRPCDITP